MKPTCINCQDGQHRTCTDTLISSGIKGERINVNLKCQCWCVNNIVEASETWVLKISYQLINLYKTEKSAKEGMIPDADPNFILQMNELHFLYMSGINLNIGEIRKIKLVEDR